MNIRTTFKMIGVSLLLTFATIMIYTSPAANGATSWQQKVDPWVLETAASTGETEFIIFLTEQADLSAASTMETKLEKGTYVYETLSNFATRTQQPLLQYLKEEQAEYRSYWVVNMIWVRGDQALIEQLSRRQDVQHIFANPEVRFEEPVQLGNPAPAPDSAAIEWNINLVNAPAVWAAGFTGQGAVIGGQDSGYYWQHAALQNQYRGWNGSSADHDYQWHDAIHSGGGSCGPDTTEPCDDHNHGTHTMGTMVGDDGGANQIGMAPSARWIGCRNMDQGVGTPTTYTECYQWFIAPTRINGSDPDPAMAPHVINNSWGCPTSEGCTDPLVLETVVQNVRAAGILTVHSAGNSGPGCNTVNTPAGIYAESFSVGATSASDLIANFSSRGNVTVDGSGRLKPDISAPGVNIRSSLRDGSYQGGWDGTSMAGPHVAGLVALLISANPSLAGDVDKLEDVIEQTALQITTTDGCGGDTSSSIPNNTYGWGRIDALAAYDAIKIPFATEVTPTSLSVCAPSDGVFNITVDPVATGYNEPISLSAANLPPGTGVNFSINPVIPAGVSTMSITNTAGSVAGSYWIDIMSSNLTNTLTNTVQLDIALNLPGAVSLTSPPNNDTNSATDVSFSWMGATGATSYMIEIATDSGFSNIVDSASGISGLSYTPAGPLSYNSQYYWRVTPTNGCGNGNASPTYSFTTQEATLTCNGALVDFEAGIPVDWTVIADVEVSWTPSSDPACSIGNLTNGSGEAACADSDIFLGAAYSTELQTPNFDLPGTLITATLDFKGYFRDYLDGSQFEVDIWSSGSWNNLLTWTNDITADPSLDLSPYFGQNGLQIRFHYSGDGGDYYAEVDEVELLCSASGTPTIGAAPLTVYSPQQPNVTVTRPLTISNSGTAVLNWTITEDNTSSTPPFREEKPTIDVPMTEVMQRLYEDWNGPLDLAPMAATPCIAGMAGSYPCNNVDLLSFLPLASIGGGTGNDIWGWTDPLTNKEYAIMGRSTGTAFVDISDPVNPIYLGNLPPATSSSLWRDIKVYANHAFIVSEASNHGMQVFDLSKLRAVPSPPTTFTADANYNAFSNAHNIVIDEMSGFAYAVGTNLCNGGLHMIDIRNPLSPANAGCFGADDYTHDAQCVTYNGPQLTYIGREICFNSNEDTLTIVDVTDKSSPLQLSRVPYSGARYTHQAWLTEDQTYLLMDDEKDEQLDGLNTRTYIWDVSDLTAPVLIGNHTSTLPVIDHNQYVRGHTVYQSNYHGGLRILDATNVATPALNEIAYFDIYPSANNPNFNGSWSNYPYYASDLIVVSGYEEGLFVLEPQLDGIADDFVIMPDSVTLDICETGTDSVLFDLNDIYGFNAPITLSMSGVPAGATAAFDNPALIPPAQSSLILTSTTVPLGNYRIDVTAVGGGITHNEYLRLNITPAVAVPTLSSPPSGSNGEPVATSLSWNAAANANSYLLEVASDPAFASIVYTTTTSLTNHTTGILNGNSTYYWRITAYGSCNSELSTTFNFTTGAAPSFYCETPNLTIPDVTTVTDSIVLGATGIITDFNVSIQVNHDYVGDLVFQMQHEESGSTVTLIDRPDYPNTSFGCSGDNINATLDDAAAAPVENQCDAGIPTINGTFSPNEPLSLFNGEDINGTWTLVAADVVGGTGGTLVEWCIYPSVFNAAPDFTLTANPASADICIPDDGDFTINIATNGGFADPVTLSSSGAPAGTTVVWTPNPVNPTPGSSNLTIGNSGAAALGSYTIMITGTDGVLTQTTSAALNLLDTPAVSSLATPADSATGVALQPTFSWSAVAGAGSYLLEVDDDPGFGSPDYSLSVPGTAHTALSPLNPSTVYYWRVTASNSCGTGVSSTSFSFTTAAAPACTLLNDMGWLTVTPGSGSTTAGSSSVIDLIFDSTGLSAGIYTGNLCIDSNDSSTPQLVFPVTLEVCGTPADPAGLGAAISGSSTVELGWNDTAAATYDVYRNTTPYFIPGTPYMAGLTTFLYVDPDPNSLGDPLTNYYYTIIPRNSCGDPANNDGGRVGEFDFAIVPGS